MQGLAAFVVIWATLTSAALAVFTSPTASPTDETSHATSSVRVFGLPVASTTSRGDGSRNSGLSLLVVSAKWEQREGTKVLHTSRDGSTAGRTCLTYRMQPIESTASHVQDPSLNSRAKQAAIQCTHRKFNDAPEMAFVMLMTEPSSAAAYLSSLPVLDSAEVVAWFDGPGNVKAETNNLGGIQKVLKGENHFQVYSTSVLGEARVFNRVAKFSQNAQLVFLARDVDAPLFSAAYVRRIQAAFDARPALALVGCAAGKIGTRLHGHGGEVVEELKLVDKVVNGPLVVRREAFLALGMFAHMRCPGECELGYEQELSLRAWLAGYEVGLLPTKETPPARACEPEPIPGLYTSEALKEMRTHVVAAREDSQPAPSMQNCSHLPTPKLPVGFSAVCDGLVDYPKASLIVQYFRRPANIKAVMKGINTTPESIEVFINNDSGGDHAIWRRELSGPNQFLVYSHDIHEIRAYNRLGLMSNSEMLITLQDDDVPSNTVWLDQALRLFAAHPKLSYMTGYRARPGAGGNVGLGREPVRNPDPATGVKFMFVYKLVAGPLFMRRSTWLDLGMFNMNFSCAGDPGIHFEYEYSIRTWWRGLQAGIYDCGFKHHVGDWKSSGTRANKAVAGRRREIGMRNSMNVKFMYRGIHGNVQSPLSIKAHETHLAHAAGKNVDV